MAFDQPVKPDSVVPSLQCHCSTFITTTSNSAPVLRIDIRFLIPANEACLVLTASMYYSTRLQRFAYARLLAPYLTGSGLFLNAHHHPSLRQQLEVV
jgi:hypothetical protein